LEDHALLENFRIKSREMAAKFDIKGVISAYEELYQKVSKGKVL
jgi:hypothetical protein